MRVHVDSKNPPPLHAAGVGTSGWWGEWKGFSFVSRAFVRFGAKRPFMRFRRFQVSVGEVFRFKDVEISAFSGMLHFRMFECFCFGLDDFAKFGKLKMFRRMRRALINLLAYLQKLQ